MLPPRNICHHVEGVAHKFIVHCSISFLFFVEVCELYKLCHKNQLLIWISWGSNGVKYPHTLTNREGEREKKKGRKAHGGREGEKRTGSTRPANVTRPDENVRKATVKSRRIAVSIRRDFAGFRWRYHLGFVPHHAHCHFQPSTAVGDVVLPPIGHLSIRGFRARFQCRRCAWEVTVATVGLSVARIFRPELPVAIGWIPVTVFRTLRAIL